MLKKHEFYQSTQSDFYYTFRMLYIQKYLKFNRSELDIQWRQANFISWSV